MLIHNHVTAVDLPPCPMPQVKMIQAVGSENPSSRAGPYAASSRGRASNVGKKKTTPEKKVASMSRQLSGIPSHIKVPVVCTQGDT